MSHVAGAKAVPFFDWRFHPENKWWVFDKGAGKTNTRFGRFVNRQFITGSPSTPAPSIATIASPVAVVSAAAAVTGSVENPIVIDD